MLYYEILQVNQDASSSEIRKAFKRLAVRFHPDKNPGNRQAEERFKQIAEAYEVLSDDDKRRQYDRNGRTINGFDNGTGHARDIFESFFGSNSFFNQDPFDDPFFRGSMFGSTSQQQRGSRRDIFSSLFQDMDEVDGMSQSFSSSYSTVCEGGLSKSVRTTTEMHDGERVTKTETTVRFPDGRVERTVDSTSSRLQDHQKQRLRY